MGDADGPGDHSDDEDLLGRLVKDRYRLSGVIGDGAMGKVYEGHDTKRDRRVALKILRRELANQERAVKRFHREMRAAARVRHPNTVNVYGAGRIEDGRLYMVMEFVDGRTLRDVVRKPRWLGASRVANFGRQMALGLQAAHDEGILHRDLKPTNIMITNAAGVRDQVKILDFGIARFLRPTHIQESATLTLPGWAVGSPGFMAPEQARRLELDARTDLYGLGVLLYYMATRSLPFGGASPIEILSAHASEPVPRPSARGPVPEWLEAVILSCLEKDPAQRPDSALAIARLLER